MFESVAPGPADPMYELKVLADSDTSSAKVDLGVGVYRNTNGGYHELRAVKTAKKILDERNPGHDYELTTGNPQFLQNAVNLLFGETFEAVQTHRIASVQTISGTGACHLGAMFLQRCLTKPSTKVYIGTPAWGNYEPLFKLVGLTNIEKYAYYSPELQNVDFDSVIQAVRTAPSQSVFILQGCCHNPSGADLKPAQWRILADEMKKKDHFPFLDIAYQGLGSSMEGDAFPIRLFAEQGFEMIACQSFSKNFGLYGERCGVLHVVTKSEENASRVKDQLRSLIRWEFSSSPAYGSRLASIILEDEALKSDWLDELSSIRERLQTLRTLLYRGLVDTRQVPGNWASVINSTGLFCFLPLTQAQCQKLIQDHHIYLPLTGRVNVSGLNDSNLEYVISAIEAVVNEAQHRPSKRLETRL